MDALKNIKKYLGTIFRLEGTGEVNIYVRVAGSRRRRGKGKEKKKREKIT
jgi:hypothetical protein